MFISTYSYYTNLGGYAVDSVYGRGPKLTIHVGQLPYQVEGYTYGHDQEVYIITEINSIVEGVIDGLTEVEIVNHVKDSSSHKGLEIKENAFVHFSNLKKISYTQEGEKGKEVKFGGKIFLKNPSLTEINFQLANAYTIPDGMFEKLSQLKTLTLPDSTTTLGLDLFSECVSLSKLTIPKNVTKFDYKSLNAPKVTELTINSKQIDSWNEDTVVNGVQKVVLPNLIEIPRRMFYWHTDLKEIELSPSIKEIGTESFFYCRQLSEINLHNTQNIGEGAFGECYSLNTVYGLENVVTLGKAAFLGSSLEGMNLDLLNILKINDYCFGGTSINSITCGTDLDSIGVHAFNNSSLVSVNLTKCSRLRTIPACVFALCVSLQNVFLHSNVRAIETRAFFGCSTLDTSILDLTKVEYIGLDAFKGTLLYDDSNWTNGILKVQDCILDSRLDDSKTTLSKTETDARVIANCTFANYFPLTDIEISGKTKAIGKSCYFNNYNVSTLKFNGSKKDWKSVSLGDLWNYNIPVRAIICKDGSIMLSDPEQYHLWYETIDGTESTLANSSYSLVWDPTSKFGDVDIDGYTVETVGPTSLFESQLLSVQFNKDISAIDDYVFYNQSKLETINLGNITSIGAHSFEGCSTLTTLVLPKISKIDTDAFKDSGITSITIPSSASVLTGSFSNCPLSKIQIIYEDGGTQPIMPVNLGLINLGIVISRELVDDDLRPITSVKCGYSGYYPKLSDFAFAYCSDLVLVDIGPDVSAIGKGVFAYCPNLKKITVNDNKYNFSEYGGLVILTEEGVQKVVTGCTDSSDKLNIEYRYILDNAFFGFLHLKEVSAKSTIIGESAFEGCSNLTNYYHLEPTTISIGNRAFKNCTRLESLPPLGGVGNQAFMNCTSLPTTLEILMDQSKVIKPDAFEGCSLIDKITWKLTYNSPYYSSGTESPFYAIKDQIKTVEFTSPNNSARYIADYVCYGMTSLTEVIIPIHCKYIGKGAFKNCTTLTLLTYAGKSSAWGSIICDTDWKTGSGICEVVCKGDGITIAIN